MVFHTSLEEMAQTFSAATRHRRLELSNADEIHTLEPTVRVATHACPVISPYILRLEPVVVYLQW